MPPGTANGYSPPNRVFQIPEIVELVLSSLDPSSTARSARVCKKWSEIALNLLWRNVNDIIPLLQILGPLGPSGDPEDNDFRRHAYGPSRHFTTKLGAPDWERFSRYARRVRSLTYDTSDIQKNISPLAFDEVARTRLTLHIFPNLRHLFWWTHTSDRMRLSLMFMHEHVAQFSVHLHSDNDYPLPAYFREVVLRMPNLTHLDLRFDFPARDIEAGVVDMLRELPKLKQVVSPLYTLTSKVMEGLSKLPQLGVVQFEFSESQGRGNIEDVLHFSPQLEDGAFPSLWDLSLSAKLDDATAFLNSNFGPANLTSLYVHVLTETEPEDVTRFLAAIAENCQLLTHLYLDYMRSPVIGETDPPIPRPARLTWDVLRPVLSLPNLVVFEIRWDRPIKMTQADVEELASKWPSLEALLLNCEPLDPTEEASLTLHALLPFARHCPNLRELGLYISATQADDIEDADRAASLLSSSSLRPFLNLKRLSMGLSSISDPGLVALFLSHLVPLSCELSSGVTWPEGFGMAETNSNRETLDALQTRAGVWWEMWAEAAKVLPLLTKLRIQERNRRSTLEKEVEDLQTRCQLLGDRAGPSMRGDDSCIAL